MSFCVNGVLTDCWVLSFVCLLFLLLFFYSRFLALKCHSICPKANCPTRWSWTLNPALLTAASVNACQSAQKVPSNSHFQPESPPETPAGSQQDPNTKRFKRTLIYFDTDTVCTFSGKSPLSSHKTSLKQQINGQKQRKNERKRVILFWFITPITRHSHANNLPSTEQEVECCYNIVLWIRFRFRFVHFSVAFKRQQLEYCVCLVL